MSNDATPQDVKRYQRQKLLAMFGGTILSLLLLSLLAFLVLPAIGPLIKDSVGPNAWLQLLASAALTVFCLEVGTLPIDFWSSYVVEHQHGLSNQTLGGWIGKRLKGWLVGAVLGMLLLSGLYGILWAAGNAWWIWATVGWLAATLILGRILPVVILPIFYKVVPVENDDLLSRFRKLSEGTTLAVEGVYRLDLSAETKKANAALAGLGRSRRVLLGDTLLADFSPEEIEVVFAHELGHHVHGHLAKSIVLNVFTSILAFWLIDVTMGRVAPALGFDGVGDPIALPLLLWVLALFGLALSPLQNAISRKHEFESDAYALQRTQNRDAFRTAFAKLAQMNKSDPNPHPLVEWLFYDHPAIGRRLAAADAAPPK
ncbi:MAG: M48 family metallopeptidase [Gemmataceae bacterium]|nr:M48 family metallopeptidase [Gemmataceae bacterium]